MCVFVVWAIWRERNVRVFSNKITPILQAVNQLKADAGVQEALGPLRVCLVPVTGWNGMGRTRPWASFLCLVSNWNKNHLVLPKRIFDLYPEPADTSKSEEPREAARAYTSSPSAGRLSPSLVSLSHTHPVGTGRRCRKEASSSRNRQAAALDGASGDRHQQASGGRSRHEPQDWLAHAQPGDLIFHAQFEHFLSFCSLRSERQGGRTANQQQIAA